jgi:DNA-binding transcriptional ArsR family regulator
MYSLVPQKNIASILSNESNLRILDKLKARPYYPRELAAEMKLSEPFIVRRLKAMEEYGIVEGRWENEGARKVKRYYPLDLTMQLGKDGLKVTSGEARVKTDISLQKEAIKLLIWLPVLAFIACGIIYGIPILLAISLALITWQLAVDIALYRHYRYKALVTASYLLIVGLVSMTGWIAVRFIAHIDTLSQPDTGVGLAYGLVGAAFFIGLIYHVRFSQAESKDFIADKRDFIQALDSKSIPVKLFYIPFVLRWKINEYFNLI